MTEFEYTADKISAIDLRGKGLIDVVFAIEKKPMLWLEENSLANLSSFLGGWVVGRNCRSDGRLLEDFQEFVARKFGMSSMPGWCRIIRDCRGDDFALAAFFELFREFLEERGGDKL